MYSHALTYPSLHKRPARPAPRVRARRRPSRLHGPVHHLRVVPRPRVARASWAREIARATLALANVAAVAGLLYYFF